MLSLTLLFRLFCFRFFSVFFINSSLAARAKMSLSRAQNIFMPENVNSIVISPYLFVTAVEILAIAIRSDSNIRGIKVGDDETKVLAYLNDMTTTLSDASSVERLLTTVLNGFLRYSGQKMKLKKTKTMWIRANKGSSAKLFHLNWVTGVKNLGIYFSCHKGEAAVQDFEERLNQIQKKKTINLWSMRGLSLFGKVTIIKTFLIPKLLFVSSIIEQTS